MSENRDAGRHPDEGELVRYLDGELAPHEGEEVKGHVERCDACALDLDLMQRASASFREELAEDVIQVPNPINPTRLRWRALGTPWKVAATIAILLPLSATVRPVRAFMVTGWASVIEGLRFGRSEPAPVSDSVSVSTTAAVITFSPQEPVFAVDVASWQDLGSMVIQFVPRGAASAQISPSGGPEVIMVVPNRGLRIDNQASSTSNYRVTLPETLDSVYVSVNGERIAVITPEAVGDSVRVSLTK